MIAGLVLGGLALLSFILTLWQWVAGRRFPLHQRVADTSFAPGVTLFKPLKGCDEFTERCLRSWLTQAYPGPIQVLFGVASAEDPVCALVRKLLAEHPDRDAALIVCGPPAHANAKVCTLARLEAETKHDIIVISDADVLAPPDLLANVVAPLKQSEVALTNCFYRLANPSTPAMRWEAVAINADFWSQVLQSNSLKSMDFALGAVMAIKRKPLADIGGIKSLADCLADDYQLGHRLAQRGHRLELCPVVVECWSGPMGWSAVWKHQLRWARTIRVCQPTPYFFSILSHPLLWPVLWLAVQPSLLSAAFFIIALGARILTALDLQKRLNRMRVEAKTAPFVPLKDALQIGLWLLSFLGNRVEWRGERLRLQRDGTVKKA